MSDFIKMKCSLGHVWILPINGTRHVVIPDWCRKCIKQPDPVIAATVEFNEIGAPTVVIDKR